jgi:hypothetical protein
MGSHFLLNNRRVISYVLVLFLLLSLAFASGCAEKKVRVRTGTRIICKYGDVIEDNTKFIKVPKSKAGNYYVRTIRRLCDKHRKVERLLAKAQEAVSSGNEQEAKALVKEITKSEPALQAAAEPEDAKSQVAVLGEILNKERQEAAQAAAQIQAAPTQTSEPPASGSGSQGQTEGQSPATGGDNSGSQTGIEVTTPAPESLTSIFPSILPGYNKINETQDLLSISRLYDALDSQNVKFLTMSAEQFTNAAEAQKWIDSSKRHYAKDTRDASVKGSSAYFGTDGREFAYLGWVRGSIAVELEMLAESGAPGSLYGDISGVASQTN